MQKSEEMNVTERFKIACATNDENPRFAPINDEYLGKRISGGFIAHITENGNPCRCFVFDNGEHFVYDMSEEMLYSAESFPQEWFIHKYLEKIIYDFKEKYISSLQEVDKDGAIKEPFLFCKKNEIMLQSNGVVRLLPFRDQKIVCLTNILLPLDLRWKGIGLKLISDIFLVCEKLGYKLRLTEMVESFYDRMVRRGATIITPLDEVEITPSTNLGLL